MLGQCPPGDTARLETEQTALSQDAAARRSTRWTGYGVALLMLIGFTACVLVPLASHASPKASGSDPALAFNPSLGLRPGIGRPTAIRSAFAPGGRQPAQRPGFVPRGRPAVSAVQMMAAVGEAPNVKVGDSVPDVFLDSGFPPEKVSLRDLTKGKKVVLLGLPGAFTPTWSSTQVPGYLAKQAELKAKGISDVITYCVNDGAVMKAWAVDQKVDGSMIQMFGDPRSEVTEALGLVLDHPGPMSVLGNPRSKRFSMFIDDGIIQKFNIAEAEDDPAGDANPSATLVEQMLLDLPDLETAPEKVVAPTATIATDSQAGAATEPSAGSVVMNGVDVSGGSIRSTMLLTKDGDRVSVGSVIGEEGKAVVVFLRHLGWPLCWDYALKWQAEKPRLEQSGVAGPLFISVGRPEQLQNFLNLNPELKDAKALIDDSEDFQAYKKAGFNYLMGDKQIKPGDLNFKPPQMMKPGTWFKYLANVANLAPVPKGQKLELGGKVPEGVKVLGGTYAIDGDEVLFSHQDQVPGDVPELEDVFKSIKAAPLGMKYLDE